MMTGVGYAEDNSPEKEDAEREGGSTTGLEEG
jgi:hypothetical protein